LETLEFPVENRIDSSREAGGAALVAFAAIVAVTVGWWALALWPTGAAEPEWLARTRAACFGAARGGLPDAGGWVLLVGQPIGMFALLGFLFRSSLAADFRWLARHRILRLLSIGSAIGAILVIASLGAQASGLWTAARERKTIGLALQKLDRETPSARLVDQSGRVVSIRDLSGTPALLTIAFGHCATVCPATVGNLLSARRAARREDVPILILTVDPWRDTPDRLATIAQHWALGPRDRLLTGEVAEVIGVLDELGIGRRRNETTGDIEHTSTAFVIDVNGRLAWRGDGDPREIVRLVGKL
jgi:cytochrome oxidase Cu insertion factor (SCO1/SenC/PrrC family)